MFVVALFEWSESFFNDWVDFESTLSWDDFKIEATSVRSVYAEFLSCWLTTARELYNLWVDSKKFNVILLFLDDEFVVRWVWVCVWYLSGVWVNIVLLSARVEWKMIRISSMWLLSSQLSWTHLWKSECILNFSVLWASSVCHHVWLEEKDAAKRTFAFCYSV